MTRMTTVARTVVIAASRLGYASLNPARRILLIRLLLTWPRILVYWNLMNRQPRTRPRLARRLIRPRPANPPPTSNPARPRTRLGPSPRRTSNLKLPRPNPEPSSRLQAQQLLSLLAPKHNQKSLQPSLLLHPTRIPTTLLLLENSVLLSHENIKSPGCRVANL